MTHPLSDEAYTADCYENRIRELESLLGECEKALEQAINVTHEYEELDYLLPKVHKTLAKLRGQKSASDS